MGPGKDLQWFALMGFCKAFPSLQLLLLLLVVLLGWGLEDVIYFAIFEYKCATLLDTGMTHY
jgi:hypothetical protein